MGKKSGVELIAAERQRQIGGEGYTPEHDDEHAGEELAYAAACYAAPERVFVPMDYAAGRFYIDPFPKGWHDKRCCPPPPHEGKGGNVAYPELFEGKHRIRMLVKAGALIAAEIDRLSRLSSPPATKTRGGG